MERLRRAAKGGYFRQHWRRLGLYGIGGLVVLLVAVQLLYPWNSLPPYTVVDGAAVGGMAKDDAVKLLDKKYQQLQINLYFGDNTTPYRQPHPADIGLTVNSRPEVEAASYPVWLRFVPTSIWWAHVVTPSATPVYARDAVKAEVYVKKELGKSCDVKPQNASLIYKDKKLQVVSAVDGGTCKLTDVQAQLSSVTPTIASAMLRVPMDADNAKVHDKAAADFAEKLLVKTKSVAIKAGGSTVPVPQDTLLGWLDFAAPDSGITAMINVKRASDFFTKQLASKVAVAPGTTRVSTRDFVETARTNGTGGQILNTKATADLFNKWLKGEDVTLVAQVQAVAPQVVYSRTYTKTDTGLAALLTHYAQTHPGTFGISYAELTGVRRHAGYNDTRVFETASTYKLFVAYGTLKRIESGKWHWSDKNISNGRNLQKCFNDMIELSDNECAKALLDKIGYSTLTNEIHAIGLTHSSFMGAYIQSTPGDLVSYLGMLASGQLLSQSSTDTLLYAMKHNIYRQGIPSGTSATVADKVGFLSDSRYGFNLLHDAAIVYSPSGTYVLVIMTDGSSWSAIADLTRQIEAWRAA